MGFHISSKQKKKEEKRRGRETRKKTIPVAKLPAGNDRMRREEK